MSKWNGIWSVMDVSFQKDIESHPTKAEAMKVVNELNDKEHQARRYKKYAVVPLTSERLDALKAQEK